MDWIHCISYFFGGVFLANSIPHLVSGMTGRPFQTPFAKPPGRGLSSSTINMLWGFFNLAIAYVLLCRVGNFHLHCIAQAGALGLGILLSGLLLAYGMGRFHGGNSPGNS